jgi:hypothetical protein
VTYPAVCSKWVTLPGNANRKPQCARNPTSGSNVKSPAIRAWGQYHSRIWIDGQPITGCSEGATAEKAVPFPCAAHRSQPFRCCAPSAGHVELMWRSAPASRNMTDDDHNLDDLKNRLSRGFGVQVREDLQVRAEIIIQPEEGRWVFTPNELSDLAEGDDSSRTHRSRPRSKPP